jgi:hypothetical protein
VYRGTSKVAPEVAVEGLSWTTSHENACWFACRYTDSSPVVLRADVPVSEIIYWSDERKESEVILRSVPPVELDKQHDRWNEIARSVSDKRMLNSQLALASLAPKM